MHDLIHIGKTEDRMVDVPIHEHSFWELIYVRAGTGRFCTDHQQADFAPGSIFLVRPRQLHHEVSQEGYGNYFLFFKDCFLSGEQSFYQLQDTVNSPIRTLIGLLHSEFLEGHPYGEGVYETLLESLQHFVQTLLPITNQNVYVEQLRREIEAHFRDPDYSPSALLNPSPFCPEHFRRLFVKSMGVTPLQYLISLRTSYAKSLIDNRSKSGCSFKQIAYSSGYSDYYYFSRQFKQQTGFPPREWAHISPYTTHMADGEL